MLISKRLQKFKAYFQSFRMGSNEKGFFVQPPISVSVMSKQVNSTYILDTIYEFFSSFHIKW